MFDAPVISSLRQRRSEAGLSQNDLAQRIGISRQAVVAIEAGRQVPSTAIALLLARVLRCTVEDLFRVQAEPRLIARLAAEPESLSTERVALGRVDGDWVAHPIPRGDRPADGLLLGMPNASREVSVEPLLDPVDLERTVLVAGCAPLLGLAAGCLDRRFDDARATWIDQNSTRALELLEQGLVHVAGLHLVDTETPGGHSDVVQRRFFAQAMTIVNLARWRQGLIVQSRNPLDIRRIADVLRPDVRFTRRDEGAGAQQLLERLLAEERLEPPQIPTGPVASGHTEVARLIRLGLADVGVGAESAALAEGLEFIPLAEERFDLVVPQHRLDSRPVTRLLQLIESSSFRADANRVRGYDLSTAGHVSTVPAH